jgi:predicted nucleotidyltransferase
MAFDNIISVYLYGSMVYGTANAGSDYDFIVIVKDKHDLHLNSEVIKIAKEALGIEMKKPIQADVHAYTEEEFLTALNGMEISFLECVNGKSANFEKTLVYGKDYPMPKINVALLRDSLSRKASNSWVKSKKKLQPLSPD